MDSNKDRLERRRQAYVSVFNGPDGEIVLSDLMSFCRANSSTFDLDARVAAMLDGRREVYLRIQEHTELSIDDLCTLKGLA